MFRYKYYKRRIPELDFLRGIAILLVLFSHYPVWQPFKFMWIGVDLFFVLSGFLVAGLLIKEYRSSGTVRIRRFLIRRGLKIYPAFYIYLFFTLGLILIFRQNGIPLSGIEITWKRFLAEIFYMQNYFDKIWVHHWTLAVEEHFYFLLAGIFLLLRKKQNAIDIVMKIAIISLPLVLIMRIMFISMHPGYWDSTPVDMTHLRIDSLFAGVLLACLYHTKFEELKSVRPRIWLAGIVVGALVIISWFSIYTSFNLSSVKYSYTVIYIGFSLITIGAIMLSHSNLTWWHKLFRSNVVVQVVASIGVYSYSIYLWHVFLVDMLYAVIYATTKASILYPLAWRYFFPYLIISLVMGILTSRLIEIPVLKWRDRIFPAKN